MAIHPHGNTDEDLALALSRGERSTLAPLVERHHSALIGYLYRMTGGDRALAEDIVQESFLRLLRTIDQYEYPRPFKPYLYAIATNLARDHFKRAETNRTAPLITAEAGSPFADHEPNALETVISTAESVQRAVLALRRLPDLQREAVILRYYEELSLADIADVLGVPVGTIKSRISLGLKRLREHLQAEAETYEQSP